MWWGHIHAAAESEAANHVRNKWDTRRISWTLEEEYGESWWVQCLLSHIHSHLWATVNHVWIQQHHWNSFFKGIPMKSGQGGMLISISHLNLSCMKGNQTCDFLIEIQLFELCVFRMKMANFRGRALYSIKMQTHEKRQRAMCSGWSQFGSRCIFASRCFHIRELRVPCDSK